MRKTSLTVLRLSIAAMLLLDLFGLPLHAYAAPAPKTPAIALDCCKCTISSGDKSVPLCLLKPNVQDCQSVEALIKTKIFGTKDTYTYSCSSLDDQHCQQVGSGSSAECGDKPTLAANITLEYLNLMLASGPKSLKKSSAAEGPTSTSGLQLNIPIPGVTFPTELEVSGGMIYVPYLAIYVTNFQKYLIGIGLVAAAIMLLYGGFLYLFTTIGAKIQSAKDIIQDSLIGLVLILGCYVILANINPNTTNFGALQIPTVKRDPFEYMGNAAQAPGVLMSLNIQPRKNLGEIPVPANEMAPPPPGPENIYPNYLTIPKDCPTRSLAARAAINKQKTADALKSGQKYVKLDLTPRIGDLPPNVIQQYLDFQAKTGIPAAAFIANMMTEGAGACVIQNIWGPDAAKACGCNMSNPKTWYLCYYNFGGVGCSVGQMPADQKCANPAFPPAYDMSWKEIPDTNTCGSEAPLGPWNWNNMDAVGGKEKACNKVCPYGVNNYDCGFGTIQNSCYPQPSNTTMNQLGVRFHTVQCSKAFHSSAEFIGYVQGFLKPCMIYNTSAYDFAYCVGMSMSYASDPEKGKIMADIIEANCLCGSRDASGCKRDKDLEAKMVTEKIKRSLETIGKCIEYNPGAKPGTYGACKTWAKQAGFDYQKIAQDLYERTAGTFVPRELDTGE